MLTANLVGSRAVAKLSVAACKLQRLRGEIVEANYVSFDERCRFSIKYALSAFNETVLLSTHEQMSNM